MRYQATSHVSMLEGISEEHEAITKTEPRPQSERTALEWHVSQLLPLKASSGIS